MATETGDAERQIAELKKQLEAAQGQASSPVTGWGGLFSLVGSVVALVPRWLVVAAGVIFIAWLGFDLYANVRVKMAEVERIEAQSRAAATTFKNPLLAAPPVAPVATTTPDDVGCFDPTRHVENETALQAMERIKRERANPNCPPSGETFDQRLQRIDAERKAARAACGVGPNDNLADPATAACVKQHLAVGLGETPLQRLERIKAEKKAAEAGATPDALTKEQCEKLKARGWTDLSGCEQFGVTP